MSHRVLLRVHGVGAEVCAHLLFMLTFPDSRREKAEAAAVGVKAGQRPPRSGRRALKDCASATLALSWEWLRLVLAVCIWWLLRQNLLSPAMFLCLHLPRDFLVLFSVQPFPA